MIILHMKTDPNAAIHADFGLAGFILSVSLFFVFGEGVIEALLFGHAGSFVVGIGIEVTQRIQRAITKDKQNIIKESILDVIQTGLFYITYWVRKGL